MTRIRRLGFAFNPTSDAAVALRQRALDWCQTRSVDAWSEPAGELEALRRSLPGTSALIVLGGDGTFLRAARAVADADVPLLGVNLGKVGFLSKVEADQFEPVLEEVVDGSFSIDDRMALHGLILPAGGRKGSRQVFALNDIVVARGSLARVVRMDVAIGPSHLATFVADGLIVASPTGSTGYSFSAGGPILDPVSRNLVVTPIAGYLSAIRSVVVSPLQTVRIRVVDAYEALLSVDGGEDIELHVGDVVEVAARERPIRFVEPKSAQPFWDLLRHKVELLPELMTRPGRLLELTVADLALIDRLDLAFETGLNVITGETGAGKSLLIDALGLALGARADSSLVRHGADLARVTARMERAGDDLRCVREVNASGRSSASLDGETVTVARLAEVAGPLVEIHGQHDQQRLLDEKHQRDLLDAYGDLEPARAEVRAAVGSWRANEAALGELALEPRELVRRLELAEHEAADIEAARLRVGEAAEIRARLGAAQHGEAIARGSAAIRESLGGEGGVRDSLGAARHAAAEVGRFDGRFDGLVLRLDGLDAEAADIGAEARNLADQLDHDPAATAALEERLSLIFALERRYGDDEAAVIEHGMRMAAEATRLRDLEGERDRRLAEAAGLLDEVARAASNLSAARTKVAGELSEAVATALDSLGFGRAEFRVAVTRRPADGAGAAVLIDGEQLDFDASGIDDVIFRFAPNAGEPARPLARIASGGELSRVALAIKEVLAAADQIPTLVFDEIDTGIGGRSADPVGRSLWLLARDHQVLCVTHLPQIAAHADAHFRISKRQRKGRTVTEVERLNRGAQLEELALMLGGEHAGQAADGGAAARAGAEQLLGSAEAWRESRVARA